MAMNYRALYRTCSVFWLPKPANQCMLFSNVQRRLSNRVVCKHTIPLNSFESAPKICLAQNPHRYFSKETSKKNDENEKPLGLFQKFKKMYRDYWYVLVPVHVCTSAVWLGCFYYAVVSGLDIIGILEKIGVTEKIIAPMRDSKAGYVALTYALYKIATPLRYAVTLGGTTVAIRKLEAIGWIKPVPSNARIRKMFHVQKDNIHDKIKEKQIKVNETKTQVMEEVKRYKVEMRSLKDKLKKF